MQPGDADRPRRRRTDNDDGDGEPGARTCDWCGEPLVRAVPLDCVRLVSAAVHAQLAQYTLGHAACVYSACAARMPATRRDDLALLHALLEAQADGERVELRPQAGAHRK
jgi:hypothetical protein